MRHRVIQPELMDDPGLDPALHDSALRGLTRLNALSRAAASTTRAAIDLLRRADRPADHPVRILDIATGAADVPIALARRTDPRLPPLQIIASDISPTALGHARERAARLAPHADITFTPLGALSDPLPPDIDLVTCSLFLHHLENDQIVELLRRSAGAASIGIVVNDLVRATPNRLLIALAARTVTRSHVVHIDADRSIRAALTRGELTDLASRAGLENHRIRLTPPCRMILTWTRPATERASSE